MLTDDQAYALTDLIGGGTVHRDIEVGFVEVLIFLLLICFVFECFCLFVCFCACLIRFLLQCTLFIFFTVTMLTKYNNQNHMNLI